MYEKIYHRINFQVFVSYVAGWRDCCDLSNNCNGFCKCVMVSGGGGFMQEKSFFEEMRLEGNDVGIAFVYFSWHFKPVIRRFFRSVFTYDLAEMTRRIANLCQQHEKICTIVKILQLVRTLALWHSFNKVFYVQSLRFDSYLQICCIYMHIMTIVCFWNVVWAVFISSVIKLVGG